MANPKSPTHYDPSKWLPYTRAAAAYGVSTRTLMRLAESGKVQRIHLPHRRPSVLLSASDLREVLSARLDHPATA